MTTDFARVAIAVVALGAVVVAAQACGSGAGLDAATLPRDMRAPYDRFEARCSRCHSLSRPLSAPVHSVDHWEKYVTRMRRMPGSGINENDAALILEFLTYYTEVIRGHRERPAPDELPLTAGDEQPVDPPVAITVEPIVDPPADPPIVAPIDPPPTETDDAE